MPRAALPGASVKALLALALVAAVAAVPVMPSAADEVVPVPSVRETDPGAHSGDSIDDPAIWVHPTDPSRSLVLANDKLGSLDVYDLDGRLVQRLTGETPFWGNVDVRQGVQLAGRTRDIVAVNHGGGIRVYEVDPDTRVLASITDGTWGGSAEGLCLYRSGDDDQLYAVNITLPGHLRQWELGDADGDGLVEGTLRREFQVGSEAEGCVAHDETGELYVSEEDVALWRYEAEPDGGRVRTEVDRVAPEGHVAADLEGLAIADAGAAGSFLLASAQNVADASSSYFTTYDATGANAYRGSFRVVDGVESDDCDRTDGIATTTQSLGPDFPQGAFVCQDHTNGLPGTSGNQNLKLVPLQDVVPLSSTPANRAPVARAEVRCDVLRCTFTAAASSDSDGDVVAASWDLGDGARVSGETATHDYAAPGSYPVVLTVTDNDGGQDRRVRLVATGPAVADDISFVGATRSTVTKSSSAFTTSVHDDVVAGDGLVAVFSGSGTEPAAAPAGWTQVASAAGRTTVTTVWQRVADGTEAGQPVTVRLPGYTRGAFAVAAYRGTALDEPLDAVRGIGLVGSTTQLTTPGVESTGDDAWRLSVWTAKTSADLLLSPPDGETVRAQHVGHGSGAVSLVLTDSAGDVLTGPQGGLTAVADPAVDKATMWTLLLQPAVPGPDQPPPANQPPTAGFTHACQGLTCSFDATGSADADGVVAAYDWVFEDTARGSGATPPHTFSEPGTYPVTLTVTDDDGATTSVVDNVTVTAAQAQVEFVASNTSTVTKSTTDFTTAVPSSVQEGDGLLAVAAVSSSTGVAAPAGWTQVGKVPAGSATTYLWQRVATAADAGSTVRVGVPTYQRGVLGVLAYRGGSRLQAVTAYAGQPLTTSSSSHVTPSLGNEWGGAARVSLWTAKSSSVTSWTQPLGEQVRTSFAGSGSGRVSLLATDPGNAVAVGTHGGLIARTDTASNKVTTWTVLLGPAG